jgi:alkylation response protein AidB-like acyl-CoA dehydrogenase
VAAACLLQGGRNNALGGALAAAQRAWSYSQQPATADSTPAQQQQQQQQQLMSRSQADGQAMLLPDADAGRSLLGDFGDAMSDVSEDEDEMTQEEVSMATCSAGKCACHTCLLQMRCMMMCDAV